MTQREVYSGDPPVHGLAQAVRVGKMIYLAGVTAYRDGAPPEPDMEAQMRAAYARIAAILDHFGASLADVVEQTVFVTDMDAALRARHVRLEVYGAAGDTFPASATVEVSRLGRPGLMVEIKVSAHLP